MGRRPIALTDAEWGWGPIDRGELNGPGQLRDLVVWEIDFDAVD